MRKSLFTWLKIFIPVRGLAKNFKGVEPRALRRVLCSMEVEVDPKGEVKDLTEG